MKLIDPAGREIKNLRISVTQRCNLDCIYCHREGEKSHGNEMSIDRIINIVESAAELGINEIKITGGEPLMRDDIVDIVEGISSVDGIGEISMTTNGTLLKNLAKPLKDAGLNRVNIGCDSLHSNGIIEKNRDVILPGLISARKVGLTPIKINMVVLRGINDHEIWNMIEFAKKYKAVLQLIELIPLRRSIYNKYKFSLDTVERELHRRANKINIRNMQARRQYILDGVTVEVVRPGREFCMSCSRLRITSDGKIKPCLMRDDNLVDTDNVNIKDLKLLFMEAVSKRGVYYEN